MIFGAIADDFAGTATEKRLLSGGTKLAARCGIHVRLIGAHNRLIAAEERGHLMYHFSSCPNERVEC